MSLIITIVLATVPTTIIEVRNAKMRVSQRLTGSPKKKLTDRSRKCLADPNIEDWGLITGDQGISGLLSNQREKSINLYFIRVPLRKKWYSKAQFRV